MRTKIAVCTLLALLSLNASAQQSWIRINQTGYTPASVKVAVLGSKEDPAISSFELVDLLTGETVLCRPTSGITRPSASGLPSWA